MVFIVFRYIKVTLKGNRTIFAPLADPIRTNFYVLMFVFLSRCKLPGCTHFIGPLSMNVYVNLDCLIRFEDDKKKI